MDNLLSLDTETTGLNVRQDQVIGFSFDDGSGPTYIIHKYWNGEELIEETAFSKCVELLKSFKGRNLCGFNMSFDLRMIKNYFGVDLFDSLAVDVQILINNCNENISGRGLKDYAEMFLGVGAKAEQAELKAHLKSIGAGAKEFYKADKAILAKYGAQDAKITLDLAKMFLKQLYEQKLDKLFFEESMPVYREVMIPIMDRGIAIDLVKMRRALSEISADIKTLESIILQDIKPVLAQFEEWYLQKNYPLKSRGLVFNKMKEGLNLLDAQKAVAKEKGDDVFNLQSKNHLKFIFFNILKMKPISFTEHGAPQVDETFLDEAAKTLPWVNNLIIFNKLNKIKSTYIERILDAQEGGIFYPEYHLHRTVSGRMSGDFQQLPRPLEENENPLLVKYVNQIRDFFIARPGHILIDDDYDSLEPRVFAAVAGDEALTDIFKKGHDFYSTIAIMVEGLKDVSADKSAPNYLGKVNKNARQLAKAYSLGIAYGLDAYKLHKDLNISQKQAELLVSKYFKAFPKLAEWQKKTRELVLTTGQVQTRFGRVRRHPDIPAIYAKHGDCILNMLEVWKKYNHAPLVYAEAKKDYRKVREAVNNAYNHQIQGLAGHILNRAAIAKARKVKELGLQSYLIGAIHDELLVECVIDDKEQSAKVLQAAMESTTIIETPLRAIPSFGNSYLEAKGA